MGACAGSAACTIGCIIIDCEQHIGLHEGVQLCGQPLGHWFCCAQHCRSHAGAQAAEHEPGQLNGNGFTIFPCFDDCCFFFVAQHVGSQSGKHAPEQSPGHIETVIGAIINVGICD